MADDPLTDPIASASVAGLTAPDPAALRRRLARLAAQAQAPWLHAEAARRMGSRLEIIRAKPARILDWGAWSGGTGDLLRRTYPQAVVTAVEPTAGLLARHAPSTGRPTWWPARLAGALTRQGSRAMLQADVPAASAELLWANMVLHAVADPVALMARWRDALAVDGMLMFSCLGPDTARELQLLYRRLGWPPARHDLQDMHDIGDQLVHAGFADPVMDMERLTLTWRDATAMLAEIHGWGGNAHPQRFAGLRTPGWHSRLLAALEELRRPDGTLALTVELIYGHALRPVPRARMQAQTTVSLDDMRAMTKAGRSQAQRS